MSTLWLASQASCVDTVPRTQIMAVADAEPMTREVAATLEVVVKGGSGREGSLRTERFLRAFSGDDIDWPRQVAIGPLDDDATRVFEYVATVRDDSDEEVSRVRAIGDFVAEETLMLLMVFQDSCLGRICPEEETCRDGECVSAFIDTSQLPPYDPDDVPSLDDLVLDAGMGDDGGPDPADDAGTGNTMTGVPSCEEDNGGCDALVECRVVSEAIDCGNCPLGYEGDGESGCSDIDECASDNGGCDAMVECTNMEGTFQCGDCPTGFTGGGDSGCNDLDECASDNGGCDPLTECTNTPGARTCGACPGGYDGDGESGCADVDECLTDNGDCDPLTTCSNTAGSRSCGACPAGYAGAGETGCTDVNECLTDNGGCDTLTTCSNTTGSRDCGMCPGGYDGDGEAGCSPELPGLELEFLAFTPAFDPDVHSYTATATAWRSAARVTPTLSAGQTAVINGVELSAAQLPYDVPLQAGDTTIEIAVREPSRPEQVYTVTISSDAGSAGLVASDVTGTPAAEAGDQLAAALLAEPGDGGRLVAGMPGDDTSTGGIDPTENDMGDGTGRVVVIEGGSALSLQAAEPDDFDAFGSSIALSGSALAVGAPYERSAASGVGGSQTDDTIADRGAVYVFRQDGVGDWSQEEYFKPFGAGSHLLFGHAVALDGDTLVVGAPSNGSTAGAVYTFQRDPTTGDWSEGQELTAFNGEGYDLFGWAVALQGDVLAVSAAREGSGIGGIDASDGTDNSIQKSGAVYVYRRNAGTGAWEHEAYIKAAYPGLGGEDGDRFGDALDLDGNLLVVGARNEESNATTVNGDQQDNSSWASGAVYVFRYSAGSGWSQEAYLKSPNNGSADRFGAAVDIFGLSILVGAPGEDANWNNDPPRNDDELEAGAAYLFRYDGSGWVLVQDIRTGSAGDAFGSSVALSDSVAYIGTPGEASMAGNIQLWAGGR